MSNEVGMIGKYVYFMMLQKKILETTDFDTFDGVFHKR